MSNDVDLRMKLLRKVVLTGQITSDPTLAEPLINRLLSESLSESQVNAVAKALSVESITGNDVLSQFWLKVESSNSQGSDLWLEAQYQLARISVVQQKSSNAKRRLGVVNTLYANWGSSERKRKADELLKSM